MVMVMSREDFLYLFLKEIEKRGLLTKFIINIFGYKDFHDYNYICRIKKIDKQINLEIFDNVSEKKFNRYEFDFGNSDIGIQEGMIDNVWVMHINVRRMFNCDQNIFKLAHLCKLDRKKMVWYAFGFLDWEFVRIIISILKNKSIF